jgi:hypothetical protein
MAWYIVFVERLKVLRAIVPNMCLSCWRKRESFATANAIHHRAGRIIECNDCTGFDAVFDVKDSV